MAMGMSYEDFWDGDAVKARYVRETYEILSERMSFQAWLQGQYVYEAILDSSPVLNAFSKRHKPFDYTKDPYPVTDRAAKLKRRRENDRKIRESREAMQKWAEEFNRNLLAKQKKGGD